MPASALTRAVELGAGSHRSEAAKPKKVVPLYTVPGIREFRYNGVLCRFAHPVDITADFVQVEDRHGTLSTMPWDVKVEVEERKTDATDQKTKQPLQSING